MSSDRTRKATRDVKRGRLSGVGDVFFVIGHRVEIGTLLLQDLENVQKFRENEGYLR